MNIYEYPSRGQYKALLARPTLSFAEIEMRVRPIIDEVAQKGDEALRKFALDFDNILLNDFKVTDAELRDAENQISVELKNAIDQAYENISVFHKAQQVEEAQVETMPGVVCWRKSVGIRESRDLYTGWFCTFVFYGFNVGHSGTNSRLSANSALLAK